MKHFVTLLVVAVVVLALVLLTACTSRSSENAPLREKKIENLDFQDAQSELERILKEKNFDFDHPDFLTAVDAMDEFYYLGFASCDSDMFLWERSRGAQAGACDVSLLRQFGLEGEDEYWQVCIEITYADSADLLKCPDGDWGSEEDGDDIDQYFADIKKSKLCDAIYKKDRKASCKIWMEET